MNALFEFIVLWARCYVNLMFCDLKFFCNLSLIKLLRRSCHSYFTNWEPSLHFEALFCFSIHFWQTNFHTENFALIFFLVFFLVLSFLFICVMEHQPTRFFSNTNTFIPLNVALHCETSYSLLMLHQVLLPFCDYNWVKLNSMYAYFPCFSLFAYGCMCFEPRGGGGGEILL
jgi:hypothetical protein